MKLSIKNFLAVMTLMAIVGGDTVYGMNKRKEQPKGLEQQDNDEKKKRILEILQEMDKKEKQEKKQETQENDRKYLYKAMPQEDFMLIYSSYKSAGYFNDTIIKKNCIPVDEYNPLNCPGIPEGYFPFVRKAFKIVDIIKHLIITGKIDSSYLKWHDTSGADLKDLALQDLGPENIPNIPLKYSSLIREAYDENEKKMKNPEPRNVSVIAERLGMDCDDFIEILKELMKNYNKPGYYEIGIHPYYLFPKNEISPKMTHSNMNEEIAIDKINKDTLLWHAINHTSFEDYSCIRKIYDQRKKEGKNLKEIKEFNINSYFPEIEKYLLNKEQEKQEQKKLELEKLELEKEIRELKIQNQEKQEKNNNACNVQ